MAVDTPTPQATYSPEKGIAREAKEDGTRVRNELEQNGPEAAARRLWDEVQAVPEKDRDAYSKLLQKELEGDGKNRNVLPELAISFGMLSENRDKVLGKDSWTSSERTLNERKIIDAYRDEKNPLARSLYNELHNQYKDLRKGVSDGQTLPEFIKSPHIYESKLNEILAQSKQQANNRKEFGLLATNEKLFKGISGGDKGLNGADGEITRDDVVNFKQKWDKDLEFRKQYANENQKDQVDRVLMSMLNAFDDPNNKNNKPGSILKDNAKPLLGYGPEMSYGKMTQQSLLDGLGYKSIEEAKNRLPAVTAGEKPLPGVTTLPNYDNTKLGYREGPSQVTERMLNGQDEFFKDAPGGMEKARRDLTEAMGVKNKIFNDKQGANQVTPENRDQIIKTNEATGNTRLRDWFVSRYPATPGGGDRPSPRDAEPAKNYDDSTVKSDTRSLTVAKNMLKDSGLDDKATQALADVLGSVWIRHNVGKPLLSDKNLEIVREKIKATGNTELRDWFNKRYLPKDGRSW